MRMVSICHSITEVAAVTACSCYWYAGTKQRTWTRCGLRIPETRISAVWTIDIRIRKKKAKKLSIVFEK